MATTTQFTTANALGVNFTQVFTPGTTAYPYTADYPPIAVGTTVYGTDETAWVYCLASAAIAAYDVVLISAAYACADLTTTNATFGTQVGVAPVAIASGSYGWIQRLGKCTGGIFVKDACAPNVSLTTTASTGVIDDISTTGKTVTGIIVTATNNAGSAAATAGTLNWPTIGATL